MAAQEAEANPCEPIGSPEKVAMGKSQEVKGGNTLA